MLAFDHAIVLTRDVERTASWLLEEHGLASVPGGRHHGHGTANTIVPLGPDYLELMYVADEDEARTSPIGSWALERTGEEPTVAALMVRVPNVTPFARRLDLDILDLERQRADGVVLSWRLAGLARAFSPDPRPVFVECLMAPQHHPGRDPAPHRTEPRGITWVEWGTGEAEDDLGRWLGRHELDIRTDPSSVGPTRVAIETADGTVVIP